MTPTLTRVERRALRLLIKFAWGNPDGVDYHNARRLVIETLELADDRPLDVKRRRADLNAFLEAPVPQT